MCTGKKTCHQADSQRGIAGADGTDSSASSGPSSSSTSAAMEKDCSLNLLEQHLHTAESSATPIVTVKMLVLCMRRLTATTQPQSSSFLRKRSPARSLAS